MFRTPIPYSVICCLCSSALVAQTPPTRDSRQQALDEAMQGLPPNAATATGTSVPSLRLADISLNVLASAGASTARNEDLADLQGGGHDPKRRGFTLQQAELSIGGAVDPYVTVQSHIVFFLDPDEGETLIELEEAFLVSQALPYGLQLKAGMFLTEFGRLNQQHAHAWDWQDQPIVLTRILGGDGMRAPGARVSWLLPTAGYNEVLFAVQNADGEQMTSFLANEEVYEERPVGGRAFDPSPLRSFGDLVYTGRFVSGWDFDAASSAAVGVSAAVGPNATGAGADTWLWGADFVYKWRPGGPRGWPFLTVQGEFVAREFDAAAQVDEADPLNPVDVPGRTLRDRGAYLQVLWGFDPGWDVGLRGDWVSGSGDSYDGETMTFARDGDPFRADRYRISPLLQYHPSEFSRVRLQYNYDDSDALEDPEHSVWLGFEVLIGKHPAHVY